jgi:hypothetical protein
MIARNKFTIKKDAWILTSVVIGLIAGIGVFCATYATILWTFLCLFASLAGSLITLVIAIVGIFYLLRDREQMKYGLEAVTCGMAFDIDLE